MADQRLTSRPSASDIDDLDLIHIVDVSDPTDDPSGTSKKGVWSLFKSTLQTFFDAIYQVKGNYVTTDTVQQINEDKGYNRSDAQIEALGDLSLVNKRYVLEKILGGGVNGFVTTNTNQTTGLTGNKTWDGKHEFKKIITSSVVPAADFDVPNKIYVDTLIEPITGLVQVSQSNLSFGESYIDNYRSRVLDDGATYFPNNGGYQYALAKEQGIQNEMSLFFTPSAVKTDVLYNVKGDNFTVARNSIATFVDEDGIIKTAEIDVARIDFSDGDGVLLLEDDAANLFTYSEDFTQSAWEKTRTSITSNQIISPDGTLNADLFEYSDDSSNDGFTGITSGASDGSNLVFSVYVKKGNYDKIQIANASTGDGRSFDLTNITSEPFLSSSLDWSIEEVGNGWVKVSLTTISTVGNNIYRMYFTESYGAQLNDNLFIWGAQLEQGSVSSSYIPTLTGVTVTRLADQVTLDTSLIVPALTSITETIDGVEQTPIITIPATYTIPFGNINKIIGLSN